jgi:hypothetical protein
LEEHSHIAAAKYTHEHPKHAARNKNKTANDTTHVEDLMRLNKIINAWHSVKDPNHSGAVTAIASAVTTLIVLVYTIFSALQWCVMRESNSINRQALVSVQRAFVNFIDLGANTLIERYSSGEEKDKFWGFRAIWENSGTTPGVNAIQYYHCRPLSGEPTAIQFQGEHAASDYGRAHISPKGRMLSGEAYLPYSSIFVGMWRPGPQTTTKDQLFAWGWVAYRDVFPNTDVHVSEFCRMLSGVNTPSPPDSGKPVVLQWDYCKQHNCADEECKDYSAIVAIWKQAISGGLAKPK